MLNPLHWDYAAGAQKLRDVKDFVETALMFITFVVTTASALANKLPYYENMKNGKWKNFYKNRIVPAVGFLALNWRAGHRLPAVAIVGPKNDTTKSCPNCGAGPGENHHDHTT